MEREEQIKTLKDALDLERLVKTLQSDLGALERQRYPAPPAAPVKKNAVKAYPEIVSSVVFDWKKALLPTLIFIPWIFIYLYRYQKERNADIERIRNSDEYKARCAQEDRRFERQEEEFKREFEEQTKIYNNKTLPDYQKEKDDWTAQQNKKIAQKRDALNSAKDRLDELYERTKIVPTKYRSIPVLEYLHEFTSTSNYSLNEAIEFYERDVRNEIESERVRQQQLANQLADEANRLANEQNDLLYEQNQISEQARKEAKAAAIVGTIQRHNINKNLKDLNNKS